MAPAEKIAIFPKKEYDKKKYLLKGTDCMMNNTIKGLAALILCGAALSLWGCAGAQKSDAKAGTIRAAVVEIEKFGHVVLDVTVSDLANAGYALGDVVCVRLGEDIWNMPYFDGYYCEPGDAMLRGSAPEKKVALCINYGDFSKEYGVAIGDVAEMTLVEKAGVLAVQELSALQYSNDRADYSDDAAFANFRCVTAGRIGDGKLYRSASPINNEHGRASYANDLITGSAVATILNLADSDEEIQTFFESAEFDSGYYRDLYESGNVKALDLPGTFFSETFAVSVAEGFSFLAHKEPPYAIHCTEGKDRAGFVTMLLEALMGAQQEEIIADYMLSFRNYYGIDQESQPERYQMVLDNNLMAMLCHVTGADTPEALAQLDLEAAVTAYLLDAGMAEGDLLALQEKLG